MTSKHIIGSIIFGTLAIAGCSSTVAEEEGEADVAPVVDTDTTAPKMARAPNGHDGRCTGGELFIGCTQQQNGLYSYYCWCPQGTW